MKKHKKIPKLKTENEIAAFWDAHDFTDYMEDTQSVKDVVFEKPKKETISLRLEEEQVRELKRLAHKVGLGYTSLIRSWVIEKLAKIHHLRHRKA